MLSSLSGDNIATSVLNLPFDKTNTVVSCSGMGYKIDSFPSDSFMLNIKTIYDFSDIAKMLLDITSAPKEETVVLNAEHNAVVSAKGIQVGCQLFPLEVAQKLVDAIKRVTIGT